MQNEENYPRQKHPESIGVRPRSAQVALSAPFWAPFRLTFGSFCMTNSSTAGLGKIRTAPTREHDFRGTDHLKKNGFRIRLPPSFRVVSKSLSVTSFLRLLWRLHVKSYDLGSPSGTEWLQKCHPNHPRITKMKPKAPGSQVAVRPVQCFFFTRVSSINAGVCIYTRNSRKKSTKI